MKVSPVSKYKAPDFPSRAILDAHPELLRLVPRRWRGNPLVLAALTATCLIVYTRWGQAAGSEQPSKVAPIFQHGAGRGAFGCEVVNPPVFLAEDEARQVIIEEGKRAKINFELDKQTLKDIQVPVTDAEYGEKNDPKTQKKDLALDGTEAKRQIAFEYLSADDYRAWYAHGGSRSTVDSYDILGAATKLQEGLAKAKPKGKYAVFYDPILKIDMSQRDGEKFDWTKREHEAAVKAREELRLQVRDFIKWLKGQGVV